MKKKLALVMATIALAVVAVGATLAWFTDSRQVVNTFTVGNIEIDIDETNVEGTGRDKANSYKLIPGTSYVKDPKITVTAGSENCYLFMKLEVENNTIAGLTGNVVQYEISDDWKLVTGTTNVYTYVGAQATNGVVPKSETATLVDSTVFETVNGKQITINENLTKEMVETIDGKNDDGSANTNEKTPVINVIGYAVQSDNMTSALDAWTKTFGKPATT